MLNVSNIKVNNKVNEGAAVLKTNSKIYVFLVPTQYLT